MLVIRDAGEEDAGACAAVYAPYVRETAISFELEPPTPEEMASRIAAAQALHAWIVVTDAEGAVFGYAYGGPHKARAAYRWSCETSIYLAHERHRAGAGRRLYTALLERLVARGFRAATAGMTLPNDASAGLHRALGFVPIGTWRRIGWKLGAWHDVLLVQRALADQEGAPDGEVSGAAP